MWQSVATIAVVTVAAVIVGRHLWRTIANRAGGGCGCGDADMSSNECQSCSAVNDPGAVCPSDPKGSCSERPEPKA